MDELRVIKYSAMVTLVSGYAAHHGLDITDEDYDKMKQIVDKVISLYDDETV